MQIEEVFPAPRSPWQNPFRERLIGSIRRECLDHVVLLGERRLRPLLTAYFGYDHLPEIDYTSLKEMPLTPRRVVKARGRPVQAVFVMRRVAPRAAW